MKKLFLGGLPRSTTDDRLKELFVQYGDITDYVVMKDSRTKESRGFGFIEFANEESVDRILNSRPILIDNREIEVRRAMPKEVSMNAIHDKTKRVFIGGLNHNISEEDIKKYYDERFSKYGKIDNVEVKRNKETGVSRGFAFISFDNDDIVDVILIKDPKPIIFGRNCEVKKSEPKRSEGGISRRRRSDKRGSPHFRRRDRNDDRDRRSPRYMDDRSINGRYNLPARGFLYDRESPREMEYYANNSMYESHPSFDRSYSQAERADYPSPYSSSRMPSRPYSSKPMDYDDGPQRSRSDLYSGQSFPAYRNDSTYRGYNRPPY